ncbi:ParA family protein [Lysinibacillus endophyticus]|uniref:ParA family protein n=1 Tax=Ureibacillus endophyticus TaxID=1978490 RepID=UPI00209CF7E2|nr:ParA family protein [Lysinibacillus endophyticus]
MTEVYAVAMNKGGVGKTSLVSNLAGAISIKEKKKILIIDTDGQGNSSIAFGLNPSEFENTIYDVLLGHTNVENVIVTVDDYIDIIPANEDMNFLEFDILPDIQHYDKPFTLLKRSIQGILHNYDYVFIDTPPSMGLVVGNVLTTADKVIIPFVPETFGVKGLIRIISAINDLKNRENPNLEILGVVGMMVDSRTILHSEMLQQARRFCLENELQMFETIIPRSIRFANSTAYDGKPATMTPSSNPIVKAYFELLEEVFEYGKTKQKS